MAISRPEVIAFLQAIKEQPEDDTPRLILADWLEERGDPRSELLRLQVTLAHLVPGLRAWHDRREREEGLRKLHENEWLGPLATLADTYTLHRGLVQVTMWVNDFLGDRVADLAETETFAWVDGARLIQGGRRPPWSDEIGLLIESPLLAGLNSLNLGGQALDAAEVSLLAGSPHLANLTSLELYGNSPGAAGVTALAESASLAGLLVLDLDGCRLGEGGAQALAAHAHWTHLTTLQLRTNWIGNAGAMALATAPALASLRTLLLNTNGISDAGARALTASPYLKDLEALDLLGNQITPPAAEALRERFGRRVSV
jgi:uncharacterized protein (TIGR02996 family)